MPPLWTWSANDDEPRGTHTYETSRSREDLLGCAVHNIRQDPISSSKRGCRLQSTWYDVSRIAENLYEAATRAASSALKLYVGSGEADLVAAATQGALAVEYLAKSCLARIHPVLIASRPDITALAYFAGEVKLTESELKSVRTLSGSEACDLLSKVRPSFKYSKIRDGQLFETRNWSIHLGMGNPQEALDAVYGSVQLCQNMLIANGMSERKYWAGHHRQIETIVHRNRPSIEKRVATKMLVSADQFAELKKKYGARLGEYIELQRLGVGAVLDEFKDVIFCPVCANFAELAYVKAPKTAKGADIEVGVPVDVVAPVESFWCPLCELRLDGLGEVQQAGISVVPRRFTVVKRNEGMYEVVYDERWDQEQE